MEAAAGALHCRTVAWQAALTKGKQKGYGRSDAARRPVEDELAMQQRTRFSLYDVVYGGAHSGDAESATKAKGREVKETEHVFTILTNGGGKSHVLLPTF